MLYISQTKNYTAPVFEIIQSDEFKAWLPTVRDAQAFRRILSRIRNAQMGNLEDWKFLRDSVSEMRVDAGAGYRLYFTRRGNTVVILLCGGDKRTQDADIKYAIKLAKIWKE